MTSDQNDQNPTTIYTDGGPAISGPVNTGGGDIVGRDKIIQTEEIAYTVDGLKNPYLGLRAFGYEDHSIYGGREQLVQEVVAKLTDPKAPQTLRFINGASGSGKSSFVQAGLLPLLERHYADQKTTVRHALFRPSTQPLVMLWDALRRLGAASQSAAFDQATFVPDLTAFPAGQVSVLVIDQFEELFIQSAADQRDQFIDFLKHLPPFATSNTHILATLRVDYLDELFTVQPLWAIATAGIPLRTMVADDLRHAIQKPIQVNHPTKRFAPDLLDRLVQDAGEDAALLPLLQVTLAELWKKGRLISANYRSLTDAICERADTVINYRDYDRADPQRIRPTEEQTALMAVLLDLIHVSVDGADRRDVRQRRTRAELTHDSAQRARLTEELVNARLFAATTEIRGGEAVEVIDIIHESLIDNWERLRAEIDEQRQQLQRRARFQLWLGEWTRNGRQDGYLLLTDMQLAEARDIEVQGEEARAFYQQSVEWREAERQKELQRVRELAEAQRQRAQVFRNGVIVAGLLFLLAAAAAIVSYTLNGQLQQTIAEAKRLADVAFSRQLAAQSTSELSKHRYESAILVAIASGQITETLESFSAIRAAIANPGHSRTLFYGHTDHVSQATWSQDETRILTSSADGAARIWDAATGDELVRLIGHTNYVSQATWNQDESRILTSSADGTARIWDTATGDELIRLTGHTNYISQATWSQDESRILTTSYDNTARIWNAATGDELVRLKSISQATWSQDESRILTSSADNTARIWNAATGEELIRLVGHTGTVRQAIWSQDESEILTSSADNTARIWNAATGEELVRLVGHTDYLTQANWSQDESRILTTSYDKTARIWDAATGEELVRLGGHTGTIRQATWGRDELRILTSSDDKTARIWDAATGKELIRLAGHRGSLTQATWSQDESKILTSGYDSSARIRDAATGVELIRLAGHTGFLTQVIWSQDESRILTSSDDGTARIWDATIDDELVRLTGHTRSVYQATWSQDESKILTSSDDKTARIWDAATGDELVRLTGHTSSVYQATWSRDESKILTSSDDSTARIWDATTGNELVRLTGHTSSVYQATWNQNESRILTSSDDSTARIWNAATGEELVRLAGHTGAVYQAAWSRDESKILTSSADNTARIWNAATGDELVKVEGHTGFLTQATWSQDESKILTSGYDNTAHIWDATTGDELVRLVGYRGDVLHATWSQDVSMILTGSADKTARIWDATTGDELVRFTGHTGAVYQATWSQNESKILTSSADGTARIWDATTGDELVRLEGHTGAVYQAIWSQDESRVLTASEDGIVKIWYVHMSNLLDAACQWTPRNFTWAEWSTYMAENVGTYRPTCPNAPIPPDAIAGIQDEARQLLRADQRESAIQRIEELNGWLQGNGQFKSFGVDVDAFVAEVSATPTPVAP